MSKIKYIIILLISIYLFSSCSGIFIFKPKETPVAKPLKFSNQYGAYLAGRVAHLRKNFNSAADYYIESLAKDPENKDLLSKIYIILASEGRIEEAAQYAQESLDKGDRNNFTRIIIAVSEMKKDQYLEAQKTISTLKGPIYEKFINPLMSAWAYVGLNEKDKALKELEIIKSEPGFTALYYFHAGMIYDYFDDTEKAQENYAHIENDDRLEMSFRSLQVITNFYIRNNQKDKAVELADKYSEESLLIHMLQKLRENIKNAEPSKTTKILNNPNTGLSEAMFSIAATLKQTNAGIDLSHIFICLAIYSNPDYDLAKLLLADIMESREMFDDANKIYDEISPNSEAYFSAQIKKASNYIHMQNFPAAELLLKTVIIDNPTDSQIHFDLADVLRIEGKFKESIKYYKLALKNIPQIENRHWILFYALGVSYERNGQWDKAEQHFIKALEMSQNHYLALNYLGYCWIKQGKNIEQAFGMIVDAHNQVPHDGNINDSLGWAFYKLGMYDYAIKYLEFAAESEPATPIISEHLGDAYWEIGRKTEAKFQWSHSLTLKDETGELDPDNVKNKIKHGATAPAPLPYNKTLIEEKIKDLQE